MLTKFPTGLVSVVSDSYDLWNACEHVLGEQLKEIIQQRGDSGTLVVRPDSGNPPEIVVRVGGRFWILCVSLFSPPNQLPTPRAWLLTELFHYMQNAKQIVLY